MINIKVGDLLGGKYEVLQILGGEGKSGMGIVYICLNIDHNNFFALKTFQDKFLFSKEMKDSFKREALAWVQLEQHPNIVQAIAFEELDYRNFIILEYIAPDMLGRNNLTHFLLTQISYDDILKWSLQFCYGMEHASSHGVISHRDIKPDNIMVEIGKNIKITDFGLVKVVDETISDIKEPYEGEHSVSKDGFIAGTPPWMAPEQFVGKADIRSDVYSFGVVLFQMVKRGELPFTGTSIKEFQIAHSKKPIPQIDNELFPIIEYCLQKNPEDRYQNFKELRKDLEDLYREKIGTSLPSPPNKAELNISSIFNKGLSFQNLNLIDQAIQEYRKGLTIKPDNISILNQLGMALQDQGKLNEAINEYEKALNVDPKDETLHLNLGGVYYDNNQKRKAQEEFKTAIRLNPNSSNAHYNLGSFYFRENNLKKAVKEYKKTLHLNPKHLLAKGNLGVIFKRTRQFNKAIQIFKDLVKVKPDDFRIYTSLAEIFQTIGKIEESFQYYILSLKLKPDQYKVLHNLGDLYNIIGDFDNAIKILKECLKYVPPTETQKIQIINYKINEIELKVKTGSKKM